MFATTVSGQSCKTLTIGQFCEKLESIDYSIREPLVFEYYNAFSFAEFKATNSNYCDTDSCFRIGFNSKRQIREVRFSNSSYAYTLSVFDFETYRILVPTDGEYEGKYVYDNVAILMNKTTKYNYMICAMVASDEAGLGVPGIIGGVNFKKVKDITAIFILNEELYPVFQMKFLRGRMIYSADINYPTYHTFGVSDAQVFIFSDRRKALKLLYGTCPQTLQDNAQAAELRLKVQPEGYGRQVPPLWDLFGIE